jgi:hypothetical protein
MMIGVLIAAFLVIALLVALGAKHGSRPCELNFRVATYGGSSYISDIEINDEGRLVAMTHNDVIGKHSPYPLQSEGAVEYYVSVRFGVWAEKELGEKYDSSNKGWKTFCCPVTKNGRQLTYDEYMKLTDSKTRSRKNPTTRVWYEESGPPNNTSIKHTEYVKL